MAEDTKLKPNDEATKKVQGYLDRYTVTARKIAAISRIHSRQFIGTRAEGDPRLTYLVELETTLNILSAQVEVLTTLVTTKLGLNPDVFMKCTEEILESTLTRLQQPLAITSWDEQGNPIFDLVKYKEVTALWPR